jgi:8-oxo-dGTP pyrophosphatase MutT (NUDIX family)
MDGRPARDAARPAERRAARVLVLDVDDRILLLEGRDSTRPEVGTWWFTPGGGIDAGETPAEAARREVREEVGIELGELGAVVHERTTEFDFEAVHYRQREVFYLARVPRGTRPSPAHLTPMEKRSLLGARWWEIDALAASGATVYPEGLPALLCTLLDRAR